MAERFGRLLVVDLDVGSLSDWMVPAPMVSGYIGGSGLAARLLWDGLRPNLDPLQPENPLLFLTGPLTGTAGPATGRFVVSARSPATGIWGESNCGGFWGPELRFAGYDGLLINGRASSPAYLWIRDGQAELRDASRLWGAGDTYQTQERIRSEVGDSRARVACIGLAGERLIPYALILCDHGRAAGRTGMGAVMGSKNLKAIAVRGKAPLPLAQPELFQALRSAANRALRDENSSRGLRAGGSAAAAEMFQFFGDQPSFYFTGGYYQGQENVSGNVMAETILTGVTTCHACVIACGRRVTIPDGPYARPESKGPEYETMMGFGSIIGSGDMNAATHIGQVCDAYGLDAVSTSNTIGLAYLMFSRGLLTERDTDGLALAWGDPVAAEQLVHRIARGQGIGALMGQGARAFAANYGVEDLAAHVNNLEMPYHDPRAFSGMAIVYATSPRGACHNQSDFFLAEVGASQEDIGIPVLNPPTPDDGKARLVALHQDYRSVTNSLGTCIFARVPASRQLELYNAAAGENWDMDRFMQTGARIWNLKRALNNRLGLTRSNDRLPKLLLEPLPTGLGAGQSLNLDRLMKDYYSLRGWDPATGRPLRSTLERLELAFAADVLEHFAPSSQAI